MSEIVTCECAARVRLPAETGDRQFRCPVCKAGIALTVGAGVLESTPLSADHGGATCPICQSRIAPAEAAVAPSRGRILSERDEKEALVRRLLQEDAVRDRLARLGVEKDEIEKRLDRMTEEELDNLAEKLDTVAVGRSAAGVAVAILVIVALVLLIVWLVERV